MHLCIICRPLHIAVVKENIQLVRWLIEIFRRAHKDLDIFNNLRQVRYIQTHQNRLHYTIRFYFLTG